VGRKRLCLTTSEGAKKRKKIKRGSLGGPQGVSRCRGGPEKRVDESNLGITGQGPESRGKESRGRHRQARQEPGPLGTAVLGTKKGRLGRPGGGEVMDHVQKTAKTKCRWGGRRSSKRGGGGHQRGSRRKLGRRKKKRGSCVIGGRGMFVLEQKDRESRNCKKGEGVEGGAASANQPCACL